ncbi:hypothetical protein [Coxiella burnetii]|uniref:Uncharacterized protein n=1 Tax=Coxiella burnetii (strain Dugway 5J108-111) TaxID=434922 RepID=B5XH90_COXBN|nr:hypothetical protein [Coxiella burnetii]ACI23110.1 hypothetical protein CBUD_0565a [Coxiella burnetii Dugway 5J108-111]OYK80731.1 hypothetical protein CbuD7E6568_02870 [Coxiella burnetii]OYK82819.1 hypothetical protein CbuD7D7780_02890 [Coxiella burnetii]
MRLSKLGFIGFPFLLFFSSLGLSANIPQCKSYYNSKTEFVCPANYTIPKWSDCVLVPLGTKLPASVLCCGSRCKPGGDRGYPGYTHFICIGSEKDKVQGLWHENDSGFHCKQK